MSTEAWWAITLAVGLVVAIVAVVVLQLLLNQVRRIERAAHDIWTTGKAVAGNTSNTWLLDDLSQRLDDLAAEGQRHGQALSREGG